MAADAIERAGLRLAQLSPGTLQELQRALPNAASTLNPVDVLGDAPASRYGVAIDAVLRDPVRRPERPYAQRGSGFQFDLFPS